MNNNSWLKSLLVCIVYYILSCGYCVHKVADRMGEMRGARRVLTFCLLTAVIPTVLLIVPLYLRHSLYADVSYAVAESDVLEVLDGISPYFCQEQILRMNTSFRAFQLAQMPPLSQHKKHIKLRKSMFLSDDTVEYWGFYLLQGSQVTLLACSRYDGAGVLVVRGEKDLKTCNILETQEKPIKRQSSRRPSTLANKFTSKNRFEAPGIKKKSHPNLGHLNSTKVKSQNLSKEIDTQVTVPNLNELAADLKNDVHNYSSRSNGNGYFEIKLNGLSESVYHQSAEKHAPHYVNNLKGPSNQNVSVTGDVSHGDITVKNVSGSLIEDLLNVDEYDDRGGYDSLEDLGRQKRMHKPISPGHILDAGVEHGGNVNITDLESSDSSFEESLHKCYEGQELSSNGLDPIIQCYSNATLKPFQVDSIHISADGYYYFIFYSDNDHHLNPVHAEFDIFKTTYEHTNYTRGCINKTECRFPISFGGKEIVIVEIPTRDGIEHNDGDSSVLTSSCYPRMSVYAIFPVAVLFLILGCAFL